MPRIKGNGTRCMTGWKSQRLIVASLSLNGAFLFLLLHRTFSGHAIKLQSETLRWNGGHPADKQTGTCYCSGSDEYCMCTPSLAIDLVIVSQSDHVWLVRRKDTGQLATMGGFVIVGEEVEKAVRRELMEETGIDLVEDPVLFGVYSDSRRDNRRHTVSAVYVVHMDGSEQPKAADDVKDVQRIHLDDIEKYEYFADHKTILLDYRTFIRHRDAPERRRVGSDGDFAHDIVRSICSNNDITGT
jgi:8-oxo-dGTP diphosphatase